MNKKKPNDRYSALQILKKVLESKIQLSQLLVKESPFTKTLCFGVCRQYYRLEAILVLLVKKRPAMDLWLILMLGLFELEYLAKPAYATVKEIVDLAELAGKTWAKGLVNAILRRFCREKALILSRLAKNPAYLYGHPEWFKEKIKAAWPERWEKILAANDEHPPMSLRVNTLKISREAYLKQLENANIEAFAQKFSPVGIFLRSAVAVEELPGFVDGLVSVQDEAAQLATPLLNLLPGQRILDACAAPGGKTCHILEGEPKLEYCLAVELEARRIPRIQENLQRLNLQAELKEGDASLPESWWDGKLFDRILVDAPCSATGVIRRHPDIKVLRTEAEINVVTELQAKLLASLWPLLRLGGILLYCTCSILPEENDRQLENFLRVHQDSKLQEIAVTWGLATKFGRQLLPGQISSDGFYYALLKKVKD